MNTTASTTRTSSSLLSILFVALLGSTIIFLAGFAHSETLHDSAHDVRHASGFPCH